MPSINGHVIPPSFAHISAGPFIYGPEVTYERLELAPPARPRQEIMLDEFWLARFPVTYGEWKEFLDDTGHDWIDGSNKEFVQATEGNKAKFIKKVEDLNWAALTNIHGGLMRALRLSAKGDDAAEPAVDPDCVLTGADSIVFLTDGWASWTDSATRPTGFGSHVVDLATHALAPGAPLAFTLFWTAAERWEGRNFEVTLAVD